MAQKRDRLDEIFKDYVECKGCENCKAKRPIPYYNGTFCEFLLMYRKHFEERIETLFASDKV